MTSRSVNVAMAAYLDTCVISGYVKNELKANEQVAMEKVMAAYTSGKIDLLRSAIVEQEIAAIPDRYRTPHHELLSQFIAIPVPSVGGLTRSGGFGAKANPARMLMQRLIRILPDENDQRHIFVAAQNRIRFFITVDFRTILSRRDRVLVASGVEPVTPAEFVAHTSSPLQGAQPGVRAGLAQKRASPLTLRWALQ